MPNELGAVIHTLATPGSTRSTHPGVRGNFGRVPDENAQAGALAVNTCMVGWKAEPSSSEEARTATASGIELLRA